MKKCILTTVLSIALTLGMAQPSAFKYQTIVRDGSGSVLSNQAVSLKISVLKDSINGIAIFSEDHTAITNSYGLITLEIGKGNPILGELDAIDWGRDDYFIEIALDIDGGNNFSVMGTSQLLSVPYAFHARNSDTANIAKAVSGSISGNLLPPKVLAETPSDIEPFSATINGLVNGEGFSTAVLFEWGTSTGYGNTIPAIQSPVKGSTDVHVSAVLTGLQMGVNYYYRLQATNAVDIVYSDYVVFSTGTTIPQLTTLQVTDIEANSAKSGGVISDDGGAPVFVRGTVWSTDEEPTVEMFEGITNDGSGTGEFISVLENLVHNTTYFIRAYATNTSGTAYGNQEMFTTLATIPELTTLSISGIGPYDATSGGDISDDGGAVITARGVVWSTIASPTINDNLGSTNDGTGIGPFSSVLLNLSPSTTYYVRAYATNSMGTAYGDEVQFSTLSGDGFPCPGIPTITDIDGNLYNTVLIGSQCWMKENLKTTKYKNEVPVDYPGSDNSTWQSNSTGAYAWFDNDIAWKNLYGALYNSHAVTNPNGLCPSGWHVPSQTEWTMLTTYIGGTIDPNGNKLKSCRQVSSPIGGDCNTSDHPRWNSHSTHYGTDNFGFAGLPASFRNINGTFDVLGTFGFWWASTDGTSNLNAWTRRLSHQNGFVSVTNYDKLFGFSVRCLKDE